MCGSWREVRDAGGIDRRVRRVPVLGDVRQAPGREVRRRARAAIRALRCGDRAGDAAFLRHVARAVEDRDQRRLLAGAEDLQRLLVRLVRRIAGNRELRQPALRHLPGREAAEEREHDPEADHAAAAANDQVREAREHSSTIDFRSDPMTKKRPLTSRGVQKLSERERQAGPRARRRSLAVARGERQATAATSAEGGDEVEGAAPLAPAAAERAEEALDGDARELFDARETRRDLREPVVPQRLHARSRARRARSPRARRASQRARRVPRSSRAAGRCRSGPCSPSDCSAGSLSSDRSPCRRSRLRHRAQHERRSSRRPTASTSRSSCVQSFRASRCASTPVTAAPVRNGSTPISFRRVSALGASFVCSVESTR